MGSDIVYPLVLERNSGLLSYGFTGKLGNNVVTEIGAAHGHALQVCMPQGRHVGVGFASEDFQDFVCVDLVVKFIQRLLIDSCMSSSYMSRQLSYLRSLVALMSFMLLLPPSSSS